MPGLVGSWACRAHECRALRCVLFPRCCTCRLLNPACPAPSPSPEHPQTDTFTNPIFKDSLRRLFTPAGEEGYLGLSSNATFEVRRSLRPMAAGNWSQLQGVLPLATSHAASSAQGPCYMQHDTGWALSKQTHPAPAGALLQGHQGLRRAWPRISAGEEVAAGVGPGGGAGQGTVTRAQFSGLVGVRYAIPFSSVPARLRLVGLQ